MLYLTFNLVVEFIAGIAFYYKLNNIVLYNIDILIEGLTFCYALYYLHRSSLIKRLLKITATAFILFWVADFFFIQKEYEFNTYSYLLSSIVLSGFSLTTIYIFVFEKTFKDPFHNFFFWLSIGILFCDLGNVPYLMFYNILFQKAILIAYSLTIISQMVNTILYIMIIIGILYQRPQSNEIAKPNLNSFL